MARRKKPKQPFEMEPSSNRLYLHKILTFLTSDDKSQVFPSLTMEMEDILVRIAKGSEFLRQGIFDDDCKSIVNEISAVLEENKHAFALSYGFENDELGNKVMVYKKILPDHVVKEPMVFKPLRKPNIIQASRSNDCNPSLVMSRFKTTILNATLKFVKNDLQLVLQYPNMTTEQADFVKQMITQCMAPQASNKGGFKNLYDPLTEALKIFSTKYRFELNIQTQGDMKRIKFEKTLISNTKGIKDLDSSFTSNSSDGSIPLKKPIKPQITKAMAELDRSFIDTSINRLNDFLKDCTRDVLLFTDLDKHEMVFLTAWKTILKRVEIIKMFDVKGQMILDEIRGSVDRGADCGKFSVKVALKVSSKDRSVTFTKKPLNALISRAPMTTATAPLTDVKTDVTNVPTRSAPVTEHISSDSSTSSPSHEDETAGSDAGSDSGSGSGSIAYNKKIERFIKKIKTLPQNWIRATLSELNSFIQDESQASLIIPGITNAQMVYLKKLQKMLRNTDVIEAYQPDVQVIMWAMHRALFVNALKFKLSFKMTSVKKGKVRDITFIKEPCFPSLRTNAKEAKLKKKDNNTRGTYQRTLQDTSSPTASPGFAKTPSVTSLTVPGGKGRAVTMKKRPQSATGTLRRTVAKKLPPAKVKLIEGLNQPVVSEKGIMMMRSMGWEGGALGLRGEGITEPIRLQLDMVSRAGFGSAKAPSRQPAASVMTDLPLNITRVVIPYMPAVTEFKKGILQTILNMVSEGRTATEVIFPKALTQKNWTFIKHHVLVFSRKDRMSVDASPLNELCHHILAMMKKTEYLITACWGTSKTNVLFILKKSVYQPRDIDSNDWCSVASLDNASVSAKEWSKCVVSAKGGETVLQGQSFRYFVLAQILDFCQQSNIVIDKGPSKGAIEKNVLLKGTMARKEMAFIEDLIKRLNNKSRCSSSSKHENSLFDQIKGKIEGFTLKADFPMINDADATVPAVYKTIRLHKIFNVQKTGQILKNIPATEKGTCEKIEIRSEASINDFSNNNVVYKNLRNDTKDNGTTKRIDDENHIVSVNRNDKNNTIPSNTKNLTDCQNTQEHNFDADHINNCLCCLPDSDDETEKEIIEKDKPIQTESNKENDRPIVAENDIENYMSLVTNINKENDIPIVINSDKENDMPIVTDINKENYIPIATNNDKENDMAIATNNDKDNDMAIVTNSDRENDWLKDIEDHKENDIPIVINSDKENDMPIVTDINKENYIPIATNNDKENDMAIATNNDKDNDMAIVTNSDRENDWLKDIEDHKENDIPIVINSDKENDMPIVTDINKENYIPMATNNDKENDMAIATNNDKENDMAIVNNSDIQNMLQKHADFLNTSAEAMGENLQCLKRMNYNKHKKLVSADDDTKRKLLKEIEFVKKVESTLRAHYIDKNEGNQECLDKNEGSREVNENFEKNQILAITDKDLGKRLRSNGQTPEKLRKKCRYADIVKHISITPKDYPQSKITNKMAGEIQKSILKSIDYTQELPLLKCHGIQDGALSYSCYSEKSLNLIKNVMKSHDFQVTVKQDINITRVKMAFRLNTYLDESVNTLLKRLKIYNVSLNIKEWEVIKKEQCSDYVVIQVEMDYNSFKFILDERCTLYAGLDVAKFSIVWD